MNTPTLNKTTAAAAFAILPVVILGAGATVSADSPREAPVRSGQEIYAHWCADCHDAGPGHPATLRMTADLGAQNAVLLEAGVFSREFVKTAVRNGFQMMPPFRPSEISDEELERLADFIGQGR